MLHEQLKVLRPLSHRLPWGSCLDSVVLRGASLVGNVGVEPLGSHVATGVPSGVLLVGEVGLAGVITAVIDFGAEELFVASGTLEFLETGEHLPENILPRNLLLSQEHHEFVDVPVLVALVLCNCVAVVVNK